MDFLGINRKHPEGESQPGQVAEGRSAPRTRVGAPTVLMLGGFGRSGSTLLERCLAQCEGFAGLGEVLHLWERGARDHELCGCGLPFPQCPVWSGIGEVAFDGWDNLDLEQVIADRWMTARNRYLPSLALKFAPRSRRNQLRRFTGLLGALYAAAQQVTGAQVLVDSSKHPAYAYLLRLVDVNLRCVLVVRDPRGVAFSWSKVVKRPETRQQDKDMPRYSVPASIANWTSYSLLFHLLSLLRVPVLTVHYEEFMTAPQETLRRIVEFSGVQRHAQTVPDMPGNTVTLEHHHTVAGNPMRFKVGSVPLKLDAAWKTQMPARDRRLASLLSFPLRAGYRLTRR